MPSLGSLTNDVGGGGSGTPGTPGVNAFTLTTSSFVMPAVNSTVNIAVSDSSWVGVGQTLFITDGTRLGYFTVTALPDGTHITVRNGGTTGNSAPAATFSSGSKVSPGGVQGAGGGGGGGLTPTAVLTSSTTLTAGQLARVDLSSGSVPITLPNNPADNTECAIAIIASANANTCVVSCGGSGVFRKTGGPTTQTLMRAAYLHVQFVSADNLWIIRSVDPNDFNYLMSRP